MKNRQSGFTLVEIAIVLVIIGLLLGGILKGQELINSARVRNLADTNAGIQAAYYGFIDRFRQVPGDMDATKAQTAIGLSAAPTGGDADGKIDESSWGEASAIWDQLTKANFLQGSYTGGATDAATYKATEMAPINPFNGYMLLARTKDYSGFAAGARVAPAAATPTRLSLILGDNIPVDIARELDVKVDDQKPLTGVLRYTLDSTETAQSFAGVSESASTNANCVSVASGTHDWNITADAQNCNMIYLY